MGIAFETDQDGERLTLKVTDKARPEAGVTVSIIYDAAPNHRPFKVSTSGKEPQLIGPPTVTSTLSASPLESSSGATPLNYRELKVNLSDGVYELSLETQATDEVTNLRVFGFLVQYDEALLEWNSMGVGGTIINNMLKSQDGAVEAFVANRKPDLIVGWFGTNSLASPTLDIERYKRTYQDFVSKLAHAAPNSACLLIGPLDFSRRPSRCFLSSRQLAAKRWRRSRTRWNIVYGNWRTRSCTPDKLINHRKKGR